MPLATADLRVLLVNNTYVYNAAHNVVSDLSGELAGAGYVRKVLVNKTLVENDVSNTITFDADDILWVGSNFGTPDAAIIYLESADDTSRLLLCSVNIDPKVATSGTDFTLQFGPTGILIV